MKKKLLEFAAEWGADALMFGGAAGVAYGAWMIYAPAGPIVGGLFALVAGIVLARGAK